MRGRIFITEDDFEILRRLITGRREAHAVDSQNLDMLEQEIERAEIVTADEIPPDVITMNSEVRVEDLDSGEIRVYRLVLPAGSRAGGGISILAPLGTAMLGYSTGDVIEWRVPRGIRRLKILEVISQPEAARAAG